MRDEHSGLSMIRASVFCLILLCASCMAAVPAPEPSPTAKERVALLRQPTLTPRPIDALTQPALPAPSLTLLTPISDPCSGTALCAPASLAATAASIATPTVPSQSPIPSATPSFDSTIIGYSAEGRPLSAYRFGSGERVLLLVGGIHGGWEGNTVRLAGELIDHFTRAPQEVPPGVSLVIVPVANPDGLAHGRVWDGRLNANGVDLNRNWRCNWSPDAYWRGAQVNAGVRAFSEPETQALSDFILQIRPGAALFYHSSADGVFAGECGGDHGSAAMSAVYGEAAGYRYGLPFSAYPVTGTAPDWLDGQSIPSADVELITSYDMEFARNLRGVLAVMQWLVNSTG